MPNFFIVGPPKCATTSLYHYLKQHPEIFLSPTKETRFFDLFYEKGIDYYESTYFNGVTKEKIIGEATATYGFLPFVAERLYADYPNAKLLFCLREPVERAYSEWLMRKASRTENLRFRDAIAANAHQKNITLDGVNGAKNWSNRFALLKKTRRQSFRVYLESSLYGQQLHTYYRIFPKDQVLVVFFDDLKKNPNRVLRTIYNFLGVDEAFELESLTIKNPHTKAKNYISYLSKIVGFENTRKVWKLMPNSVRKAIWSRLNKRAVPPPLSKEDRQYTNQFFHNDINLLKDLLGQDFEMLKQE